MRVTWSYRRSLILLLFLITAAPATLPAQSPAPQLRFRLVPDSTAPLFPEGRTAQPTPLLLHRFTATRLYPLLPYIFFDSAEAAIPERYRVFADPEQTLSFYEAELEGGTYELYYQTLNVIGYRLRLNPEATVTVVGCNSSEPELGEGQSISAARGRAVYDYLTEIWKIDTARVRLLPAQDYPTMRSNPRDPIGRRQNRRVEITSDDRNIMQPVVLRVPYGRLWGNLAVEIDYGMPDSLVASAYLKIEHEDGSIGYVQYREFGYTVPEAHPEELGSSGFIPLNRAPRSAELIVETRRGEMYRSSVVNVSVATVDWLGSDVAAWSIPLILFPFDSSEPGPLNEWIIHEYILPNIGTGSEVHITGFDQDVFRMDRSRSGNLTARRVRNVEMRIKKGIPMSRVSLLTSRVKPCLLPPDALPEEPFLRRRVEVTIIGNRH